MDENKIGCDLQFEDFIYDIVDGNAVITEYIGEKTTLYVPAYINGYKVVGFDVFDFDCVNGSVRHIILPGTIQQFNFWEFNRIDTVRIEPGCKCIPDGAFAHMRNLKLVDLPDTVKAIGNEAFAYCEALQYVRIPDDCLHIGDSAFAYSGLKHLFIPKSVKELGENPFCGCDSLLVDIHPESQYFTLVDEMVLYTADYTRLIRCYPAYPNILAAPKELKIVDPTALVGCELYGFNIPDDCKAFDHMELQHYLM